MYCRCTRSLSISPAVYYAHLVAFCAQIFVDVRANKSYHNNTCTDISVEIVRNIYIYIMISSQPAME